MRKAGLMTLAVLAASISGWVGVNAEDADPKRAQTARANAEDFAAMEAATAQGVDPATMSQWRRGGGERGTDGVAEELEKHKVTSPTGNAHLIGKGQGATYGNVTEHNVKTWDRETFKAAVEGSRVFHSSDELGSEIGVSCDMYHPDGSNTHPETYPKFQVQLGRVALLRDMINWCIENPVKGEVLKPDAPQMRALEAYIYAQRKGTPLSYGKR